MAKLYKKKRCIFILFYSTQRYEVDLVNSIKEKNCKATTKNALHGVELVEFVWWRSEPKNTIVLSITVLG